MPFPRDSQALSRFTVLDLTRVRSGQDTPSAKRLRFDVASRVIPPVSLAGRIAGKAGAALTVSESDRGPPFPIGQVGVGINQRLVSATNHPQFLRGQDSGRGVADRTPRRPAASGGIVQVESGELHD